MNKITNKIIRVVLAVVMVFIGLPLNIHIEQGRVQAGMNEAYADGEGWLSGYSYRRAVIVRNAADNPAALANYQIKVANPVYNESGLIRSWHMDTIHSPQSIVDSSGKGNNGIGYGATLVNGKFGNALSFDGVNDYIDCGNVGEIRTVEFYINDTNATDGILELNFTAYVSIASREITASGFDSPIIYVNGAEQTSLSTGFNHIVIAADTAITADSVKIGVANGDYTKGIIDEVRFYSRVLPDKEIAEHYQAKAKLNYGDIRFAANDGITLINYWQEKDGVFWVKLPEAEAEGLSPDTAIWIYYGSTEAGTLSDKAGVFELLENVKDGDMAGRVVIDDIYVRKYIEPEPAVHIYAEVDNL